jgi:hypothetical protein
VGDEFDCLAAGLANLQFQKREAAIFTIPISNETAGWVGLNKRTEGGRTPQVNPVVGVRNHRLEEFVAKARAEVPHPYLPPSISIPLGYLTPQGGFKLWDFAADSGANGIVGDLVKNIRDYALPFMHSNSKLDDVYNTIRQPRFYNREKADYYLPALDVLLDRAFSAKEFVAAKLDEISNCTDPAADRYRESARAIFELRTEG